MTALLRIEQAGPATSIQDLGRFGAQRFGLGTAGAMDRMSLAIANSLVGQPEGAPAIEIGPLAAVVRAENAPMRIALAGAERDLAQGDEKPGLNQTILLQAGESLTIKPTKTGVFTYLSLEGGIAGRPVLGSFSVHARAGLGSPYPRPLQAGDALQGTIADIQRPERIMILPRGDDGPIRVVTGPQDDYFSHETMQQFLEADWQVSPKSDRMGYRLIGPQLAHAKGHNIVSDGIANGHIQIAGNGQPLVLLADRGTTGGYPKIACIISADLGRFAQIPAGRTLRFAAISVEEAQAEAKLFATRLAGLPQLVRVLVGDASGEMLLGANLAGNAVNARDPRQWDISQVEES